MLYPNIEKGGWGIFRRKKLFLLSINRSWVNAALILFSCTTFPTTCTFVRDCSLQHIALCQILSQFFLYYFCWSLFSHSCPHACKLTVNIALIFSLPTVIFFHQMQETNSFHSSLLIFFNISLLPSLSFFFFFINYFLGIIMSLNFLKIMEKNQINVLQLSITQFDMLLILLVYWI